MLLTLLYEVHAHQIFSVINVGMQYNFDKQKASNIDSMSVPYDYRSIMHYGRTAFGRGKLTIETRDPKMQRVIGRRAGFSELDALQMNLLYKCPGIDDFKVAFFGISFSAFKYNRILSHKPFVRKFESIHYILFVL